MPDLLRTSLATRLAGAFVLVALAAVVVLAGLTLLSARSQVSTLVEEIHEQDTLATAAAASRAHARAGGWADFDVTSAAAVAARGQAELTIRDAEGGVVAAPATEAASMMAEIHGVAIVDVPRGDAMTAPVIVDGEVVGSVELRFPASHLPTPERQIRDALSRNVLVGAALAAVTAVLAAFVVARRVGRPLSALTAAAAKMQAGDRSARVEPGEAPAEIATLAATFNHMAASIELEDELRRQLVANVAHELRTPLTILRGTTEALLDGVAAPDAVTLGTLHDETLRLTRLVADLEVLAAAEAARLDLRFEPVDVAAIAGAVVALARPAAEAAQLRMVGDLEAARVMGDPERLRQVLTTLVANALRYTPPGGTITIRTGELGDFVVATVADTGPGIDPHDLPRVFERFYRGERTAHIAGNGIGLAVARELVVAHGGSIEADNRATGGAVIRVTLPGVEGRHESGDGTGDPAAALAVDDDWRNG